VEVELVPLAAIEKAEFVFFWATTFLTVWGTVLGTWLSLVTVEHDNQPVRNLLLAVLFFFIGTSFRIHSVRLQSSKYNSAKRPVKCFAAP